jgi:hypothetical protein
MRTTSHAVGAKKLRKVCKRKLRLKRCRYGATHCFNVSDLLTTGSRDQVAQGLISSAEFVSDYGVTPTSEGYAYDFYQNFLDRAPDGAVFAYWVGGYGLLLWILLTSWWVLPARWGTKA